MEVLGMRFEILIENYAGKARKVFESSNPSTVVHAWNSLISEPPGPEDKFLRLHTEDWTEFWSNIAGRWVLEG